MSVIKWNSAYSIGIVEIDEQHKHLLSIISELYEAHSKGMGQVVIADTISKLFDYTNEHFSMEQDMHLQYKFPHAAAHKTEHSEFVSKLEALKQDAEKRNLLLALKTLDFLKDWTITHILGSDKEFGEYLRRVELQ